MYLPAKFTLLATILILTSCKQSAEQIQYSSFRWEDVSCSDTSTADSREKLQRFINQPQGDYFLLSHSDEILSLSRQIADKGNYYAMGIFGGFKREVLVSKHLFNNNERSATHEMPIEEKDETILALTYLYLSLNAQNPSFHNINAIITNIEKNRSDVTIPMEWINNAKENALIWQQHCAI